MYWLRNYNAGKTINFTRKRTNLKVRHAKRNVERTKKEGDVFRAVGPDKGKELADFHPRFVLVVMVENIWETRHVVPNENKVIPTFSSLLTFLGAYVK